MTKLNKYFEVKAVSIRTDKIELLFGSFSRQDCKDEIDAERVTWKAEGFRQIKILTRMTEDHPDIEIYGDELAIEKQHDNYNNIDILDAEFIENIEGIDYYTTGNEFDFIVAVDEESEQAITTNFLEMDDFQPIEFHQGVQISDYAIIMHNGLLKCLFEVKGFHASKLSNNEFYKGLSK